MKTTRLLLGMSMVIAIAFTACQKDAEDEELFLAQEESNNVGSNAESEKKANLMVASDIDYNSNMSFKKAGIDADCKHVDVCLKNGKLQQISINAAYNQVSKEGYLFSCDPDVGLDFTELKTIVTARLSSKGLNINDANLQKTEFELWFVETYCGVDEEEEEEAGDDSGGGTFEDGGGSDL